MGKGQTTRFCLTMWQPVNYPDQLWAKACHQLEELTLTDDEKVTFRYIIGREEKGKNPAPGRTGIHVQAYLQTNDETTIVGLQKILQARVPLKIAVIVSLGTPEQAAHYCRKSPECKKFPDPKTGFCSHNGCVKEREEGGTATGNYVFEHGEMCRGSGHRSDLADMMSMVRANKSFFEIANEYPAQWLQYQRSLKEYAAVWAREQERPVPIVAVIWGPPGSLKSSAIRGHPDFPHVVSMFDRKTIYTVSFNKDRGIWWDGYDPTRHPVVMFDDFEGSKHLDYGSAKVMTECGDFQVGAKGSMVPFMPKVIIFTSNIHPQQWYSDENDCSAFMDRLPNIFEKKTVADKIPPVSTWKRGRVSAPRPGGLEDRC